MFTGLIEEIGRIANIRSIGTGKRISIYAKKIFDDLKIDDSVAVNGVCQTVVSHGDGIFTVEAVEETINKSNFSNLRNNQEVNLERALRLSDRLGGHLVQGHVDTTGRIVSVNQLAAGKNIWIEFPKEYEKYIIEHGSICIDGVSLTVARLEENRFMVTVIPHTRNVTTIGNMKPGYSVNLEFDLIGKYVEKMTKSGGNKKSILDSFIDQPDY